MITIRKLADAGGEQFYSVESRLEDENLLEKTRSVKFRCNMRGFEDEDARSKALRFVIATDCLRLFRAFIFSEGNVVAVSAGEPQRQFTPSAAPLDSCVIACPFPPGLKRRIRSYVCMRQNRLTGLRFVVAMSRLESGRLRAVSFQDFNSAGRSMSDDALNMAVRFLHGVSFESWRKQAMNELRNRDREAAGLRRERGLKHANAFVEIEGGEKVDCACGRNRSRGLMVACERCEAWEHAECRGFRSDKQIPSQYICSACVKAEGEDVVVIRLDEQGECGNWNVEDLSTKARITDRETDAVCCVCGCEDNQYFESMIYPQKEHACDDGMAVGHPSCILAVQRLAEKACTRKPMGANLCLFCGEQVVKSVKENEALYIHRIPQALQFIRARGSLSAHHSECRNPRTVKFSHSSRGAKRMRSALNNGDSAFKKEDVDKRSTAMEKTDAHVMRSGEKMRLTTPETGKALIQLPEVMHPDKRFSDTAVAVPIKKRRLIMDAVRSPSPPSPRIAGPRQVDDILFSKADDVLQKGTKKLIYNVGQTAEIAEMESVGRPDLVSANLSFGCDGPGNDAIGGMSKQEPNVDQESSKKSSPLNGNFTDDSIVRGADASLNAFPRPAKCVCFATVGDSKLADCRTADLISQTDRPGRECIQASSTEGGGWDIQKDAHDGEVAEGKRRGDTFAGSEEEIADQKRLPDVRLHWDLNMDIEEWERPPEADTGSGAGVNEGPVQYVCPEKCDTASHDCEGVLGGNERATVLHARVEQVVDSLRGLHSEGDTSVKNLEVEVAGDATSVAAERIGTGHVMETKELYSAAKNWSLVEDSDVLEAEHVDYDDSDSVPGDSDEAVSEADERDQKDWQENDRSGISDQVGGARECVKDEEIKMGLVDESIIYMESAVTPSIDDCQRKVEGTGTGSSYRDANSESVWLKSLALQCTDFEPSVSQPNARDPSLQKEIIDFTEPVEAMLSKNTKIAWSREKEPAENKRNSILRLSAAREDGQSRSLKSSGWDRLPVGYDKAEDALRAARESLGVWNGRAPLRGSANGRNGDSQRGSNIITTFGRRLFADDVEDGARSGTFWSREDHRLQSADINLRIASPQQHSRVKIQGSGRSPAVRSRGRMESWIDSLGGLTGPWNPSCHLSPQGICPEGIYPDGPKNAAARALLKVESSGFVVAPDGTLSKASSSSQVFPSRHHTGRGATCNIGRGAGMNMSVGMKRSGLSMNTSTRRGSGLNLGVSTGSGVPPGPGITVGPGLSGRMPGHEESRDQEMNDRYCGPRGLHGSGSNPVTRQLPSTRARRSEQKCCEKWAQGKKSSASPGRKVMSMGSCSYSLSLPKSQTKSPKPKSPARPAKSSGGDGHVLGRSNSRHSRSPSVQWLAPPSLPLPTHALRSQLTPPGGTNLAMDFGKDACRTRHRDQKKERPETRTRTPPTRTSPHVVHGSALMDERDRQLLAEMRHISPSRENARAFEILRKVTGTLNKNKSPVASISGRFLGRAGCPRRQPMDKCGEIKIHVSKREAGACNSEQHCGKEIFRIGSESIARRDDRVDRCEDKRDWIKSCYSGREKEGRSGFTNSNINGDGDDDVAPRRKRPSP